MMDYRVTESTLNTCTPYGEDEIRNTTIKSDIQETYKILCETNCVLRNFAQIINGETREEKKEKDASCLWEEARLMTALAYEDLQKLNEIKGSIL